MADADRLDGLACGNCDGGILRAKEFSGPVTDWMNNKKETMLLTPMYVALCDGCGDFSLSGRQCGELDKLLEDARGFKL